MRSLCPFPEWETAEMIFVTFLQILDICLQKLFLGTFLGSSLIFYFLIHPKMEYIGPLLYGSFSAFVCSSNKLGRYQ
jgi:hypothetical protein